MFHGARSVFHHLKRDKHNFGPWMTQLETRVHRNVVIATIANKMARIPDGHPKSPTYGHFNFLHLTS
jgi:hypothetical protein